MLSKYLMQLQPIVNNLLRAKVCRQIFVSFIIGMFCTINYLSAGTLSILHS